MKRKANTSNNHTSGEAHLTSGEWELHMWGSLILLTSVEATDATAVPDIPQQHSAFIRVLFCAAKKFPVVVRKLFWSTWF